MHRRRRSSSAMARLRAEAAFTLIEVLVVILIVGILAAVALPSFLNQKQKAVDADAKVLTGTAQTAAEAYSTDHGGSYAKISIAELRAIEPTLKDKSAAELILVEAIGEGKGYVVEAKSTTSGHTYAIERTAGGEEVKTCAPETQGGCPSGGHW